VSIQDALSQGVLSSADILCTRGKGGGGLQMRRFAFFCAKTSDFSKFMVSARKKGIGSVRTFWGQEGGSIFRNIVRTSFTDRPLHKLKNFENLSSITICFSKGFRIMLFPFSKHFCSYNNFSIFWDIGMGVGSEGQGEGAVDPPGFSYMIPLMCFSTNTCFVKTILVLCCAGWR